MTADPYDLTGRVAIVTGGGTGIGLPIALAIAHAHGGTLTASSPAGARFELSLPLYQPRPE